MTTVTSPRPTPDVAPHADGGTGLVIRPAGRGDVARLVEMTDDVGWPTLALAPLDDPDALPGADGEDTALLLALDRRGSCLGLASYERADGGSSATFALDVNPAAGRGATVALVRALSRVAADHGIRRLAGWLTPADARALVGAPPPARADLAAVADDRWQVVVPAESNLPAQPGPSSIPPGRAPLRTRPRSGARS